MTTRARLPVRSGGVRAPGFTLLELVVTMAIMMMLLGIGVASFEAFDADEFEEPAARLIQMSKLAHQAAVVRGQGMIIAFDKEGFVLLGDSSTIGGRFDVPKKLKMELMPWGAKNWLKADEFYWRFGPQGVCEPMKVRFLSENGSREIAFHPLTGGPVE